MIEGAAFTDDVAPRHADRLERLYRDYEPLVRMVARRGTDSEDDADDVVQEVFLALPVALGRYEEQGRFDAWLSRLTMRTALMRRRAHLRAERRIDDTAAQQAPPHDAAILARLALAQALEELPEHARAVGRLREIEGLSHDEIAGRLGISRNASEVRLHRAMKQLRDLLSDSR